MERDKFEDLLEKANPGEKEWLEEGERKENLYLLSRLETAIAEVKDLLSTFNDKGITIEGYVNCFDNYDLEDPNKIVRFSNINPLKIDILRIFETTEHWDMFKNKLKENAFQKKE